MAKKDLVVVISGLMAEMTAKDISFEAKELTEKNSEAELDEEIKRLELIYAEWEEGEQVSGGTEEVFEVTLKKGVNIEQTIDGKKTVFEGGKTHTFTTEQAEEIIKKGLGKKA
jgi:hypothetical protein